MTPAPTDRRPPRMVGRLAQAVAWCCTTALVVPYRAGVIEFLTASRMCALIPGAPGIRIRRSCTGEP